MSLWTTTWQSMLARPSSVQSGTWVISRTMLLLHRSWRHPRDDDENRLLQFSISAYPTRSCCRMLTSTATLQTTVSTDTTYVHYMLKDDTALPPNLHDDPGQARQTLNNRNATECLTSWLNAANSTLHHTTKSKHHILASTGKKVAVIHNVSEQRSKQCFNSCDTSGWPCFKTWLIQRGKF